MLICLVGLSFIAPSSHLARAAADATPDAATTAPAPTATSDKSITIDGDVQHTITWTTDSLATQFASDVKTIKYTLSGKASQSRCVPFMDLINAAGPAFDEDQPKQELRFVVSVSALDKYVVCFSLGELLPAFGNKEVWVALDKDGKPLSEHDAPVRFIVPSETKAARWIYGATHIKVVRFSPEAPATTQP